MSVLFLRTPLAGTAAQDAAALKITGAKTKRLVKTVKDKMKKANKTPPTYSPLQARLMIIESLYQLLIATFERQDTGTLHSTPLMDDSSKPTNENTNATYFEQAQRSSPILVKAESQVRTSPLKLWKAFV